MGREHILEEAKRVLNEMSLKVRDDSIKERDILMLISKIPYVLEREWNVEIPKDAEFPELKIKLNIPMKEKVENFISNIRYFLVPTIYKPPKEPINMFIARVFSNNYVCTDEKNIIVLSPFKSEPVLLFDYDEKISEKKIDMSLREMLEYVMRKKPELEYNETLNNTLEDMGDYRIVENVEIVDRNLKYIGFDEGNKYRIEELIPLDVPIILTFSNNEKNYH